MTDPSGPAGTPADYAIRAIAVWLQDHADALDPSDRKQAEKLARKLSRGRSVWTWTFVITGGLILLGGCSKGLGLLAFVAAFLLGGVIASGVSYVTSRPNRRDEALLDRIQRDLSSAKPVPPSIPRDAGLEDEEEDEDDLEDLPGWRKRQ